MRIAILGSVALPVPPPLQGGTEWIAYHQAKGLADKGHQVLLFAAEGSAKHFSDTPVKVIEVGHGDLVTGSKSEHVFDKALTEGSRKLRLEIVDLALACDLLIDNKEDYDIVLNNMRGEGVFLPVAKLLQKKFVNVMHLNIFEELAELFKTFKTSVITISNRQRTLYPNLNYLATAYNGVETEKFPFKEKAEDYLLMISSIGRHKNQGEAIAVAKKLGKKLILAGKVRDKDYFEEIKKDIDGKQISFLGEISFAEKVRFYQNAEAFLFPILWEEPFGLVMIEAMSCGTPVVAFNHGAVSEVLANNKTGFVVENGEQMVMAVKKIGEIKRADCRKRVLDYFTVKKMIDTYEKALLTLGK